MHTKQQEANACAVEIRVWVSNYIPLKPKLESRKHMSLYIKSRGTFVSDLYRNIRSFWCSIDVYSRVQLTRKSGGLNVLIAVAGTVVYKSNLIPVAFRQIRSQMCR